jgi:hypothetical protein
MLRRWAGRRTAEVDRARIDLFTLEPFEQPLEAWPVSILSLWPGAFGIPTSPSQAANTTTIFADMAKQLTIEAVLLVTSRGLRWCPYRTYRGGRVYQLPVDDVLAEKASIDAKAIYSRFPHPILGPRSVMAEHIDNVALIVFAPGDLAVVNVYLNVPDDGVTNGHLWPLYDVQQIKEATDSENQPWEGSAAPGFGPFLQVTSVGAATLNIRSLPLALRRAAVPFRTDFTDPDMIDDWTALTTLSSESGWVPLSERLNSWS